MGEPAGVGGPKVGHEGAFDVHECGPRSTAEPLQAAAEQDVDVGFLDIEGEDTDGVKGVQEY